MNVFHPISVNDLKWWGAGTQPRITVGVRSPGRLLAAGGFVPLTLRERAAIARPVMTGDKQSSWGP